MEDRLSKALHQRETVGTIRSLTTTSNNHIDFSSNDYLGLAHSREQLAKVHALHENVLREYTDLHSGNTSTNFTQHALLGSTGSRLLSGNSKYYEALERKLASLHNQEAALLFNSGYDANLSVLSSLVHENDIVIMDELSHNSLRMGVKLSRATDYNVLLFRHNCVTHLKELLSQSLKKSPESSNKIFIIVESVYSMDGDIAPLREIMMFSENNYPRVNVIVDEAHGLGVYGHTNAHDLPHYCSTFDKETNNNNKIQNIKRTSSPSGTGVIAALGLEKCKSLVCTINTFGKAAGCHGAVVCGSSLLRRYLINYARPLIYSTSLDVHSLVTIEAAYDAFTSHEFGDRSRKRLFMLVRYFRGLFEDDDSMLLPSKSPIQSVFVSGNHRCIELSKSLNNSGFTVYPIRAPTVPIGLERIRVIIHVYNTKTEIHRLVTLIKKLLHSTAMMSQQSRL